MNTELAKSLVEAFTQKGKTLATAESLTAGMISSTVADVPGASKVLVGGVVSYASRIKHSLLAVEQGIIDGVGVVSEPCASRMAEGVRKLMHVDVAVSATGLAGPGGGTEETPVGTVFIGVASSRGARAAACHFTGDRPEIREKTVEKALSLALEELKSLD